MARRDRGLFEDLSEMPWWVSIVFGLIFYVGARWGAPALMNDNPLAQPLGVVISQLSWASAVFLIPALVSLSRSFAKRRLLDRQSSLESIRTLDWKRFEELLGEAYRRQGFHVSENAGRGADGGVDLWLRRGNETHLVQCKHWRTYKVGVKVVREMLGLVTAHGATRAIVVTSGVFTKEARDFARTQPVDLVDGDALLVLVSSVRAGGAMQTPQPAPAARSCPRCGSQLVIRQAKQGTHAGSQFWGCADFPKCRHTEPVAG